MKSGKKILSTVIILAAFGAVLLHPAAAQARLWKGKGSRTNHSRKHIPRKPFRHGRVFITLPRGYISIVMGGIRYNYHNGIFCRRRPLGHAVVRPPVNAVVAYLPEDCERIYVRGDLYYKYNDAYYRKIEDGYIVVSEPAYPENKKAIRTEKAGEEDDVSSITVNVPNKKGSYTPVKITREGDGYKGPQGEYYETFPGIDHLKIIYGS